MVVLSAAIVAAQMAAAPLIGFGFGLGYTLGSRTGYEIVFDLLKQGKVQEAKNLLKNVQNFAKSTGTESATAFGLSKYVEDINSATPSQAATISEGLQTQYIGGQPLIIDPQQQTLTSIVNENANIADEGTVNLTRTGLSPQVAGFLNYYLALAKATGQTVTIQKAAAAFPTGFSFQEKNQALQWIQAYAGATTIQRDFKRTPGAPKQKQPRIITYNRPQDALDIRFLTSQSEAMKKGLQQNVIAFTQQLQLQINNLRRLKTVPISTGGSIRDRRARAQYVQRQKIGRAREIARLESLIRDFTKKLFNAKRLLRNFR